MDRLLKPRGELSLLSLIDNTSDGDNTLMKELYVSLDFAVIGNIYSNPGNRTEKCVEINGKDCQYITPSLQYSRTNTLDYVTHSTDDGSSHTHSLYRPKEHPRLINLYVEGKASIQPTCPLDTERLISNVVGNTEHVVSINADERRVRYVANVGSTINIGNTYTTLSGYKRC